MSKDPFLLVTVKRSAKYKSHSNEEEAFRAFYEFHPLFFPLVVKMTTFVWVKTKIISRNCERPIDSNLIGRKDPLKSSRIPTTRVCHCSGSLERRGIQIDR